MNKKKGLAIIATLFAACAVYVYFLASVSAQTPSAQTNDDAIGVRVISNPNHYSVSRWYASQGFKGSPQALTVDGYEALRDGRTVYVNAADVNITNKKIYTNIYLISYNQDPNIKTVDILGQIISHWKFNDNLPAESATCSISALKCEKDTDCFSGQVCSTSTATCALKEIKNCSVDENCPANFFCDSLKSKVIRDLKRVGKLEEVREALASYKSVNGRYPLLAGGTYLPGKTTSLWPSWNDVLMPALAIKQGFVDPINRFGMCPDFDAKTCWNKSTKKFVYDSTNTSLQLPKNSYALVYSTNDSGSDYNLCAVMESRDSLNPSLGFSFEPNNPSSSEECVSATGILASGQVSNSAPKIIEAQMKGVSGREYNGFLRASDSEGDPIFWTMTPASGSWPNWRGAPPVMKMTSDANQRKVFADLAGDAGKYYVNVTITDSKGASMSTTTEIVISSANSFAQADEYSYRLDSTIPFNYSFYVSGSSAVFPTLVSGPDILSMPGITRTSAADGLNSQRVTYQGIIATSTKFIADTESVYRLTVGKAVNNFVIRIKVDKPVIKLDCATQSRVGYAYSCLLGSTKQGNHSITYSTTAAVPGISLLPGVVDVTNIYLTGTTTIANLGQEIKINAVNEYGTPNATSFVLKVNTYCGDGVNEPNTEGKGGVFNDGYESCDGSGNIATTAAGSSRTMQYACNTDTIATTPYPMAGNSYCVFKSPLDGGGYCGDTYCQTKFETKENCKFDCDPDYFGTSPVLPDGTPIDTNNCNNGFNCEPGYQCTTAGTCVKKCWQEPVNGTSVVVEEGDAVLPGVTYYEEVNDWDHYTYNSYQIVNTSAGSVKSCKQEQNNGSLNPSYGCTVIRIDNGECFINPCKNYFGTCVLNGTVVSCTSPLCTFRGQVNSCPVGYRANFNLATGGYPASSLHPGYGGACGVDNSNSWPDRESILCTSAGSSKAVCYLDSCTTTSGKAGKINSEGTCIAIDTPPDPDGSPCNSSGNSWFNDCPSGQVCVGASGHCDSRQSGGQGNTGAQCAQYDEYYCPGSPVQGGCDWVVDQQGTCVGEGAGTCTPNCPSGYCGGDGCTGSCGCANGFTCNGTQCVVNTTPPPTSCGSGSYVPINTTSCATCPVGFYCADGINAVVCDPSTYTNTTGNSVCKTCEAGYYCSGRSSKIGCSAGSYRETTAGISQGNCPLCDAGTYTATTGNIKCTTCLAGTYNLTPGNTGCAQCDAGYYCTGGTNLTPCAVGYYRSTTGGTSASSCTRCGAGTYNTTTGNTGCNACDAGYYCTGGSSISPCPAGTSRSSTYGANSGDCTTCSAGTYSTYPGSTSCSTCEANYVCTGGSYHVSCASLTNGSLPYSLVGSKNAAACRATNPALIQ